MTARTETAPPATGVFQRLADLLALAKPRLNAMAVFAVAAGWWASVGGIGGAARVRPFVLTLVGAGLVAGGASALNQLIERRRDALMNRTAERPLPAGRLTPLDALIFGSAVSVAGLLLLGLAGTWFAAGLGALTLVWYVGVYTPLKTRTTLNTLAGTVPGALPPLIGAAAATGALGPRAWFLFAVIAAWQLPHFLSIAWLYRDDYARAGYAMLPVVSGGPASTSRQIVVQGLLTVVVSLAATPLGLAGGTYFVAAAVVGVGLLAAGVAFAVRRTDAAARVALYASLVHLPVVLTVFAIDAV